MGDIPHDAVGATRMFVNSFSRAGVASVVGKALENERAFESKLEAWLARRRQQ
jgi:hypothetical protein